MTRAVQWIVTVLTVVLAGRGAATAQIDEFRKVDGKTIECLHSGLMSDLKDCGFHADWYAYVFVGSISAITPAAGEEKKIQITPEEIFHGEPPTPLTILTSQGACLPQIKVGDRWIFFLRKEDGKPIVLDYYGNISRPVANSQEQIETLRRLQTIGDFAILRGQVLRGPSFSERKPVPDARVVAHRVSDNSQFSTTAGTDGSYEFQPLPPGKYTLTVDPIGSFRPDDDGVDLTRGACWDVTLSRSPHAQLDGHVRHTDGSPVADVHVFIMREDEKGFDSNTSDEHGYFRFDSLRPGKYVVGISAPGAPAWNYAACGGAGCEAPPISLYYPGMQNRSGALDISLKTDEKRNDIDFAIPSQ
jgi:Carboxypeptidase regulatory-like domain